MDHPYGYIKDGKVYQKGFLGREDRIIGEVKEDEATTLKYFEDKFEIAKEKVAQLKSDIEEKQNKGSYLMKLIHLKDSLMSYDGLGDFLPLIAELEKLEIFLNEIISSNRERNLEIKKSLIEEAEALQHDTNWPEATEALKEIKNKWIKTGPVDPALEEEIEAAFKQPFDIFFENKKAFYEKLRVEMEGNVKYYEDVVRRAEEVLKMDDAGKAMYACKDLLNEWKSLGKIPAESRQPLWDRFTKIHNTVFWRYKKSKEAAMLNPREAMEKAKTLVEDIKKLAEIPIASDEIVSLVKRAETDWKKIQVKKSRDLQLLFRDFVFFADVIKEKNFLDRISRSKNPSFDDLSAEEQKKIKSSLLRDLISRDERELDKIKDNAGNIRSPEGSFAFEVKKKIGGQERKIRIKNYVLKGLNR
ncbi:DUF349 domain-containing protein [Penaeicola halotolerans]|uniref:DUF349 domain-containing protein n=1 Tax=Penaeicola halotolerans TaxID=2793196 RepID=UPI001CF85A77|nr:DUF349 domain-containing protein [Penaeicola halotolerans]